MSAQHTAQHSTQQEHVGPMNGLALRLAVAWAVVGVPLVYGVYQTAKKAAALFTG